MEAQFGLDLQGKREKKRGLEKEEEMIILRVKVFSIFFKATFYTHKHLPPLKLES